MDQDQNHTRPQYRICVVNGVFVSDGVGEDGYVRPPRLFAALADSLHTETGLKAWAVWPYRSRRVFGPGQFTVLTRRSIRAYARFLTDRIRVALAADPLAEGETLAFVVYSGGVPIVQHAATMLRPEFPVGAFVFFGPALLPKKAPDGWLGDATCGAVIGEYDWVQGVYPRIPRPWHRRVNPRTVARLRATLPPNARYRELDCDHWPGYFTRETWPHLVRAISELLMPYSSVVQDRNETADAEREISASRA